MVRKLKQPTITTSYDSTTVTMATATTSKTTPTPTYKEMVRFYRTAGLSDTLAYDTTLLGQKIIADDFHLTRREHNVLRDILDEHGFINAYCSTEHCLFESNGYVTNIRLQKVIKAAWLSYTYRLKGFIALNAHLKQETPEFYPCVKRPPMPSKREWELMRQIDMEIENGTFSFLAEEQDILVSMLCNYGFVPCDITSTDDPMSWFFDTVDLRDACDQAMIKTMWNACRNRYATILLLERLHKMV